MTSQCEQCRNRFFVEADGSVEGMAVSCPDCGGKLAPERDQPSGSPSDGRLRNMVDPAFQKDMGGNPLQEGIWATTDNGWQNRMKRDESFASVKTASQTGQAVPQLPAGIHNGTMTALGYIGATINGMRPGNELFMWTMREWLPQAKAGNPQPVTIEVPQDHPAYLAAAIGIVENSSACQGNRVPVPEFKALIEGIQSGQIPPPQQAPQAVAQTPEAPARAAASHLIPRDQTIHVPWNMTREAWTPPLSPPDLFTSPNDIRQVKDFVSDPSLQNIPNDIQVMMGALPAGAAAKLVTKAPTLMKGALATGAATKVLPKILKGLVPDAPEAPAAAPPGYTPTQAPTLHAVTHVHESFDTTPTSLDKIPNSEETGDTHEFKDQSTDLNPENPNEDDSGVGTLTPETQNLFEELLPIVLKYFVSDESGQGDPLIQQLDEALEREMPGYKDRNDEEDREPSAVQAKVADTQGPANPDQFKAVSEVLIEQGRVEEIPHMFEAPWEYADILAEIQNVQEPPPAVEDPAQSPIPGMPGPPGGAMPPMMPAGGPPGMMPPGAQIAAAVERHRVAADNIASKCPNCGSHTTEIVGNDGSCHCHACGNHWATGLEKSAEVFEHEDLHADPMPNDTQTTSPPKHDDQNEDASHTWQTTDGSALEVGSEYELHSPKYSIPDVVRVEQVKPTELVVTLTGEYDDLEDQITISRSEASDQEYSFIPVDAGEEPGSQDALDYMDDQAQAPRTNTEPTPSAARPFTTSWNDKLGGTSTKLAAPVQYPYSGPQLPDERTQEAAGHFDKAEQIYREQGWEAAKAFLDQQLGEFHEKHYPGQDSLAEVDVAGFGEQMRNEHGGDAPSMWAQNKDFQLDEGKKVAPVGDQLGWSPGSGGRGIFIDGNLHTWPVNKTPENPQGGLMHGEYINQFGNVRNVSAGFEIDPDGSVVDLGTPLSPEEQQRLQQAHPETNYGGGSPAGVGDFTFGKVQEDPDLAWLKEGMSMGGAPAPWQRPLEDLTGGPAYAPPVEPQPRQAAGATASAPAAGVADWLNDGTWTPSRTAGKNFTPSQQREFIDEDGEARNLDRLDLDGTHYKIRETSVQVARDGGVTRFAQPEMVREDDFALGF